MKRMVRAIGLPAMLVVALGVPTSAGGSDQRDATLAAAFTPATGGSQAAVDLHMTWADSGEPDAKPQQVHKLLLAFPAGTRIDTGALARCTATDGQIRARGPSACPRASRL